MADIITRTIDLSKIVTPTSVCAKPEVSYTLSGGLSNPCEDGDLLTVQLDPTADSHCIQFVVTCPGSCSLCGPITFTKCLCVDAGDCADCEFCNSDGVCESFCKDGEICTSGGCGDCEDETDCDCNQECLNHKCTCPPSLPTKRADGCCVECLDDAGCGPCEVCNGDGVCIPKDCGDGFCHPETGNCVQCYKNSQCPPNECCQDDGSCDCCDGYIRDPLTGVCIVEPDCFGPADCTERFGPCYFCDEGKCKKKVCPEDKVCNPSTGECEKGCDEIPCPPGQGCLNGVCRPCEELSCDPEVGLQCQFAVGCQCNDGDCEGVDCNVDDVELAWVHTDPTPGTQTDPGLPALIGEWDISPTGVTTSPPIYQNFDFNLSITNAVAGTWTLNSGGTVSALGSGPSVGFDLAGTGPNWVGFVVTFTETGTGRTAQFGVYATPGSSLDDPNRFNNSNVEFQSNGTPPSTVGSVPGQIKLCSNNANFDILSVQKTFSNGDIVISFTPDGSGCMVAHVLGCGLWAGEAIVSCGGNEFVVPVPEYFRDPSNCCDPTLDPACPDGTGDPCTSPTVVDIPLTTQPSYVIGAGGVGEFFVEANWQAAGLTWLQAASMNIAASCWSVSDNPDIDNDDLSLGGVNGNQPSPWAKLVKMAVGGCVRFGHSCELRISGCRKLQGQTCLEKCDEFEVTLIPLGGDDYIAFASIEAAPITYTWYLNNVVQTTGQTATIPVPGGNNTIKVVATYGVPVQCPNAEDTLTFSTTVGGCTNPSACNFNASANADDGTCCVLTGVSYDCAIGLVEGAVSGSCEGPRTYLISGTFYSAGDAIAPGSYVVQPYVDGTPCTATSFNLTVPTCYACDGDSCEPAASVNGQNKGFGDNTCSGMCSCEIDIQVEKTCVNGKPVITVTPTGGVAPYTVKIETANTSTPVISPQSGVLEGEEVSTAAICPGTYKITVIGQNCETSTTDSVTCAAYCDNSDTQLTGISYNCDTNQLQFTLALDACADNAVVSVFRGVDGSQGNVDNCPASGGPYMTAGQKFCTLPGGNPSNGPYIIRVSDDRGCQTDYPFNFSCDEGGVCPLAGAVVFHEQIDGVNGRITGNFNTEVAGFGENYTVQIYELEGVASCSGIPPTSGTLINTQTIAVNSGTTNIAPVTWPMPASTACYSMYVFRNSDPSCNVNDQVVGSTTGPPPVCAGTITSILYSEAAEALTVAWDFENTVANDVTIIIQVASTATCDPAVDPVVIQEDGHGESGVAAFPVPASGGSDQCVTVTIFDTGNAEGFDTVTPEGCFAQDTFVIPSCSCSIEMDDVSTTYDAVGGEFEIRLIDSDCISAVGNVEIHFDKYSDSGCAALDTADAIAPIILTSPTHDAFLLGNASILQTYAAPATDEYWVVRVEDTVGGCSDQKCMTVPACGTGCALSINSLVYDYEVPDLTVNFNVTCATSVNIVVSDSAGVLTTTPASPHVVTDGVNEIILGLNRLSEGGTISVVIENAADPTCDASANLAVCSAEAASAISGTSEFINFSNNAYDVDDALVFDQVWSSGNPLIYDSGTGGLFTLTTPDGSVVNGNTVGDIVAAADSLLSNNPFTPAGAAARQADERLTFTGNALDTETVVVDGKTYTFQAVLTDVDGNVQIGATTADTVENLMNAMILTGTPGTDYAASMTAHPTCFSAPPLVSTVATWIEVRAKTPGTAGNAFVIGETLTNATWGGGATNLSGGVDEEQWLGDKGVWNWSIPDGEAAKMSGCVTIPTTQQYWIGFSADNEASLRIDNELITDLIVSGSAPNDLKTVTFNRSWWIPVVLTAGTHIVEIEATNMGAAAAVQFAILDNTLVEMGAATGFGDLTIVGDTDDLTVADTFNVSGGVECTTGNAYYDGCTPVCTDCI